MHPMTVKSLLKAIGIDATRDKLGWVDLHHMESGNRMYIPTNQHKHKYINCTWYDFQQLWECIVETDCFIDFVDNKTKVNNIYKGCKTREEALIRKDLLGEREA